MTSFTGHMHSPDPAPGRWAWGSVQPILRLTNFFNASPMCDPSYGAPTRPASGRRIVAMHNHISATPAPKPSTTNNKTYTRRSKIWIATTSTTTMTGKGVSLLLVLLLSNTVGAAYIKYNGDFNCSYPVMVTVDSMTCDGEEYCRFGDEMDVSGSMTLEENLPSSEMCVTTKACLLGLDWMCKTYKETMNVCNAVGISGDYDGTPCPNAGAFFFGSTVQLPGKPNYAIGSGKSSFFVFVDCIQIYHRLTCRMFVFGLDVLTIKVGGLMYE